MRLKIKIRQDENEEDQRKTIEVITQSLRGQNIITIPNTSVFWKIRKWTRRMWRLIFNLADSPPS